MLKNPANGKHSHNNRESKEGVVMRLLRESKKLSLKDVSSMTGLKVAEIDHFENGRKFYTEDDIETFLKCYGLTRDFFNTLLLQKNLNRQMMNHILLKLTD